jgi:hypothetical protein
VAKEITALEMHLIINIKIKYKTICPACTHSPPISIEQLEDNTT